MFTDGYDFGYAWPWTQGHLILFVVLAAIGAIAWRRRWPRWLLAGVCVLGLWALAGAVIVRHVMQPSQPLAMPTATFLPGGSGRVLDMGAGSGRSALMVLLERPRTTVTALDIFSGYYGINDNTPERLRANARIAGVDDRLEVSIADMRHVPFADGSFDGIVSAFAIDHLRRQGIHEALGEAHRVLRPGGQFLMLIVNVDYWLRVAFPPIHGHHGYFTRPQDREWWRSQLNEAGLQTIEEGTKPAMVYFLAEKRVRRPEL